MLTYNFGRHLAILFHLLLLNDVTAFESTGRSDPSICTVSHPVAKSRYVSYIEEYVHKILWIKRVKTRRNYRQERYSEWEVIKVCCTGYRMSSSLWSPDFHDLECKPECGSTCQHGTCVAPNHCDCDPGYVTSYNPKTNWSVCTPVCSSDCHGGRCVLPEVCDCNLGYALASDKGSCKPTCTSLGSGGPEGCGDNASCIATDTCRCDEGYTILANTTIIQDPSGPVDEASTSGDLATTIGSLPTTDPSVFKIGGVTCEPLCGSGCSANASCVAPDVCRCDTGYRSVPSDDRTTNESRCVPICEKSCVNAVCDCPNRCSCFPGYEPRMNDSFECQPICEDRCVNAICAMPNRCECITGYEKSLRTKPAGSVCTPVCPGGCPNGDCVAPGICGCDEGYVMNVVDAVDTTMASSVFNDNDTAVNSSEASFRERCQPICSPGCPRGSVCIAPQQCQMQLPMKPVQARCTEHGAFFKDNDRCLCDHGWTGSRCAEAKLCGIFYSVGNGSSDATTVERIYYPDNWDWKGPMCQEKCNESISSLTTSANISKDAVRCYHLDLFEAAVGLVSWEVTLSELSEWTNETFFCLLIAESPCNATKSDTTNIIIGCSTFGLIVACAVAWYLQRRNLKAIATRNAQSRDSSTLERLHVKEAKYSFDPVECI